MNGCMGRVGFGGGSWGFGAGNFAGSGRWYFASVAFNGLGDIGFSAPDELASFFWCERVAVSNDTGSRRGYFGSVSFSWMMWSPLPESRHDVTINCLAGSNRISSSCFMDEWFFTSFPEWHSIWNRVLVPDFPKKYSHSSAPMDVVHDENPHHTTDFPIGYCSRKSSFTPRCTKRRSDGRRVRAVTTSRK